jgi:asparagine synthase (glutamine-hydrolysing)
MCGIVCCFELRTNPETLRPRILDMAKKVRHRGPDWSGVYGCTRAIMAHERLSIVDPQSGGQPLYSPDKKQILAVNGEIYNHMSIRKRFESSYPFTTHSDCEIILPLYREKGVDFLEELNGIFAFALYDEEADRYLIARDHIGIIPLYTGRDRLGQLYVASELKALEGICHQIESFPPGHYLDSSVGKIRRWYKRDWVNYETVENNTTHLSDIRMSLEKAVHRQLMSDVPYGVLLSGGLDSSIIAAIARKYAAKRIETDDTQDAWWPQLHSFAIGLKESPDLKAARLVAEYIGTVHHEIHFTLQEGLDAIRDVIYHLETYDVTTIRASTPMYLLARVIKSMGIKMVLSGEGSDEIFGGYLYFHKAPGPKEFHEETVRKLDKLSLYDCLRANKSLAAWGIEGRVPFLDKEFLDVAMTLNPTDKMVQDGHMEKWVLRAAFQDLLPPQIVWRQKEQFSDGVGYGWIDMLKDITSQKISDEQMANARYRFTINPPLSKEEYFYRSIFSEHFSSETAAKTVPSIPSVACSTETALSWDEAFARDKDPSGRAVKSVHLADTEL